MKLTPFYKIDLDDDNETEERIEAAGFLAHMDSEGGPAALLYFTIDAFPEELRQFAIKARAALDDLHWEIHQWANARGVSY